MSGDRPTLPGTQTIGVDWRGLMPWEKTMTCPYDVSHQVLPHRIQNHLWKCKRRAAKDDPAGQEETPCPNTPCPTVVAKAELGFHLHYNCKYRR